jgi:predicted DNA-binding transcriptional regulator AlpA
MVKTLQRVYREGLYREGATVTLASLIPETLPDAQLVTAKDLAGWLGVTIHSIYAWNKNGQLPAGLKIGRRTIRWKLGEVRKKLHERDYAEASSAKG